MADIPKIRFKEFTEPWEQRKVSEYANFFTGNGLNWNDISDDGEQECILYGNLYTDYGMITENIVYRTNTEIKNPVYSEYGDVLIPASDTTPTGLARATSLEKSGVLLGGDINIIRPNEGINGSCLSLALNANRKELIRLIKGTTVRHIHNSEIKDIVICLPKLETEQVRVSSYFKQLDHLITLHQRKCDDTKELKKYMLQKMFPKNGEKFPEIRFKGFTEAWEQRKLGEILERRVEQRQQSWEYPRLAFASGQGVIPLNERKTNNREQLTKDEFTKKYLVTELDDIVYNPANVKYGAIDRNKCGRGLISPIYVTFTTSEIPGFIERIVTSHDFQQKALRFEEGTVTKRQSVNPEDFVTIDILVAPQKEEQRKISEYFDSLDKLITLHQRKCDTLKELKKYMLQNMFPKKG